MLHLLGILAAAYIALMLVGCIFAEKMIFPAPPSSYTRNPEILQIPMADGAKIAAIHLPNPQASLTVLFSHGNAEDLGDCIDFLQDLRRRGFAVFAYDYPGYGLSEGKPTEKSAYRAIEAAHAYLTKEAGVPSGRIVLHGRSVGCGPSLYLAASHTVAGVVLESPFATAFSVVTRIRILPFDKFPNINRIGKTKCPILVIHARDDQVVPFSHGKRIFAKANEPKMHLWVDRGGHNAILWGAGERYWAAYADFAKLAENTQ